MGNTASNKPAALRRWEDAFQEFRPALQRFLRRRSTVPQTAEDLAQEVYLRIMRFSPEEVVQQPQPYLYRIAANVVHDFNMRMRASFITYDTPGLEHADQGSADIWRDAVADPIADTQEIETLMAPLPAAWRAALILRHRDGLSHEEIATRLKTTVEAVRKYLVRGQARLRFSRQNQAGKGNHP